MVLILHECDLTWRFPARSTVVYTQSTSWQVVDEFLRAKFVPARHAVCLDMMET